MATTAELLQQVDPDWQKAFQLTREASPYKSGAFEYSPYTNTEFDVADLKSTINNTGLRLPNRGTSNPENRVTGTTPSLLNIGPGKTPAGDVIPKDITPGQLIQNEVIKEYGSPIQYVKDFSNTDRVMQRAQDRKKQEMLKSLYGAQ